MPFVRKTVRPLPEAYGDPVKGLASLENAYCGADLSLTSTGLARAQWGHVVSAVMPPKPASLRDTPRLANLRHQLIDNINDNPAWRPKLVGIEGYSFGSKSRQHRIGEWGGVARLVFHEFGIEYIEVPPATLKKFITGDHQADKVKMGIHLLQRYGVAREKDDEIDAVSLAIFTAVYDQPDCLTLTQFQRDVMTKFKKELQRVA